jgi:anti-anti-sigma factor
MGGWFAKKTVGGLLPGDHAWLAYSTHEEQEHVVGAFVRDGLVSSDKVIYVTDADPQDLPGLRSRYRIDPTDHLRTGQLTVLPRAQTCGADGLFDPGRMVSSLEKAMARAERERFRGVRVTADMTWAVRQRCGRARVLDCEADMDARIAPSTTAIAICQVNRRSCTHDELTALQETHEVLVGADPDFDDGVLSITRTFLPRGLRLKGELDGARHAVFAEALHAVTAQGGEVHLDLGELRFVDLGALNMMAGAAARLSANGCRLYIDNASSDLAKIVRLVGGRRLQPPQIGNGEAP